MSYVILVSKNWRIDFCIVSCAYLVSVSLFSRIQVTATFYYIHMYEVVHILPKFVFSIKQ